MEAPHLTITRALMFNKWISDVLADSLSSWFFGGWWCK